MGSGTTNAEIKTIFRRIRWLRNCVVMNAPPSWACFHLSETGLSPATCVCVRKTQMQPVLSRPHLKRVPSLPSPPAERHRSEAVSGRREPGGGQVRLHAHHVHVPGGFCHRRVRLRGEPVVGRHHRPRLHAGGEGGAGKVRPGGERVGRWVSGPGGESRSQKQTDCVICRSPPRRCRSTRTTLTFLILCRKSISSPLLILPPVRFSVKLETV